MSLTLEFRTALADVFHIDAALIEVVPERVNIAGTLLETPGAFDLAAHLEAFSTVGATTTRSRVSSAGRAITFCRIVLRSQCEHGIIELSDDKAWLFLGD